MKNQPRDYLAEKRTIAKAVASAVDRTAGVSHSEEGLHRLSLSGGATPGILVRGPDQRTGDYTVEVFVTVSEIDVPKVVDKLRQEISQTLKEQQITNLERADIHVEDVTAA